MRNFKPGSPRAIIFEAFQSRGPEFAVEFGKERTDLKESSVRGFVSELTRWAKKQAAKPEAPPTHGGSRVRRADGSGVPGLVKEPGGEVSGVKWDDGTFQYCPNHWLESIDA